MTHPDIAAALVRERSRTLLAKAEAVRRARQARQAATRNKLATRGRPGPNPRAIAHVLLGRPRHPSPRPGMMEKAADIVNWAGLPANGGRTRRESGPGP